MRVYSIVSHYSIDSSLVENYIGVQYSWALEFGKDVCTSRTCPLLMVFFKLQVSFKSLFFINSFLRRGFFWGGGDQTFFS